MLYKVLYKVFYKSSETVIQGVSEQRQVKMNRTVLIFVTWTIRIQLFANEGEFFNWIVFLRKPHLSFSYLLLGETIPFVFLHKLQLLFTHLLILVASAIVWSCSCQVVISNSPSCLDWFYQFLQLFRSPSDQKNNWSRFRPRKNPRINSKNSKTR